MFIEKQTGTGHKILIYNLFPHTVHFAETKHTPLLPCPYKLWPATQWQYWKRYWSDSKENKRLSKYETQYIFFRNFHFYILYDFYISVRNISFPFIYFLVESAIRAAVVGWKVWRERERETLQARKRGSKVEWSERFVGLHKNPWTRYISSLEGGCEPECAGYTETQTHTHQSDLERKGSRASQHKFEH
jgi:hypothetical protein